MCGVPLVMPSSRDAVLVVSPIAVYSTRCAEPTLPAITGPAVEADAHAEAGLVALLVEPGVEALQARAHHLARRDERPIGVVGLVDRRAEDGHDAVAHVGDQRAAGGEDRLGHLVQVEVDDLDHLGRRL